MAWYIDKDLVDDGVEVGNFWSNWIDRGNTLEKCKRACKYKFRMLDDDGNLYYEGYSNDCNSEKAFAPLDDFGMPNAGCTEIQYKNNLGKWETL